MPASTHATPKTVAEARREIDATRERLAANLDRLGRHLGSKTDELRRRADIVRRVKQGAAARPLRSVGVAFAAGVLIGLWRGGRKRRAARATARVPAPPQEQSLLREVRSALINQIGTAVGSALATLISSRVGRHATGEEDGAPAPTNLSGRRA
jgi:ElaB/YqjD/DUF883 family membrane-anchored ribosome-binding protein